MSESPTQAEQYATGDLLGKGAFGSVYRGLNLETGEVVAIKQIKLIGTPKSQLSSMMMEIDLLKKLNHKHIVRYIGFYKTKEHLNILIEFCESGSLLHVMKKFGNFSEKLVGMYTAQVLEGLKYLHDQGVIHRDIKAANLLTDKQGTVKLADFGIASTTNGTQDVAGSPYWMAPEIVELNGATTASDVWSLGATVIELCTGNPPYIEFPAMAALFRIVQDDIPPLPQSSEIVKDFLVQCFQKDPNLRVSAQKLIKHPWMVQSRRKDDAQVSKLKTIPNISNISNIGKINISKPAINTTLDKYSELSDDNWGEHFDLVQTPKAFKNSKKQDDDDFEDVFADSKPLKLGNLPKLPEKKELEQFIDKEQDLEFEEMPLNKMLAEDTKWEDDNDTISAGLDLNKSIKSPLSNHKKKKHVQSIFTQDSHKNVLSNLTSFSEQDDHDDFSDIVSPKLTSASLRLKQAISFDEEEEDDLFLIDNDQEDYSNFEEKDEKAKRLSDLMKQLDILLPGKLEEEVLNASKQVLELITVDMELKKTVVGYHGMIPIIELLSTVNDFNTVESLLDLINTIATESPDILENICLVGAIPIVLKYSQKMFPKTILKKVANFIKLLNLTKSTLQMFIISNGFSVLITLLEETEDHEVIFVAIDAIRSIFDLPMKSIKNDLCRLLIKCQILNLLINALRFAVKYRGSESTEYSQKILNIFILFSQSDTTVKRNFADPMIIHGIIH